MVSRASRLVAGVKYRAIVGGLPASDIGSMDLIGSKSEEIPGTMRGTKGFCLISRDLGHEHKLQFVRGLEDGDYFEVLTGKVFKFRGGKILGDAFQIGSNSVAYFLPTCFCKF